MHVHGQYIFFLLSKCAQNSATARWNTTSAQTITQEWNGEANNTVLTEDKGKSPINSNESRKHLSLLIFLLQNALSFFSRPLHKIPSNTVVCNIVMQITNELYFL